MKMRTMMAVCAGGIGYVLGAKAGRARYEQIRQQARRVVEDPRLREAAQRAQETAEQKAPGVAEHVPGAAGKHEPRQPEHTADRDAAWPRDETGSERSANTPPPMTG